MHVIDQDWHGRVHGAASLRQQYDEFNGWVRARNSVDEIAVRNVVRTQECHLVAHLHQATLQLLRPVESQAGFQVIISRDDEYCSHYCNIKCSTINVRDVR